MYAEVSFRPMFLNAWLTLYGLRTLHPQHVQQLMNYYLPNMVLYFILSLSSQSLRLKVWWSSLPSHTPCPLYPCRLCKSRARLHSLHLCIIGSPLIFCHAAKQTCWYTGSTFVKICYIDPLPDGLTGCFMFSTSKFSWSFITLKHLSFGCLCYSFLPTIYSCPAFYRIQTKLKQNKTKHLLRIT